MLDEELRWLAKQARVCRRIVEIGSWKGRSTRALADHTHGVVFAVDTWAGSDEEAHHRELAGHDPWWLSEEFRQNLCDHLASQRVIMVRQPSLVAARSIMSGLRFDMVFIDAEHTYESVRADIAAWRGLVAPGGLLCGHDYGGPWVGVTHAVNEAFPHPKHQPKHQKDTFIWYVEF